VLQLVVSLKGRPVGRYTLDRLQVRIGRSPDNDVQIDSLAVSRHHAQIESGPAGLTIKDLGSNNGTFVNGVRLEAPSPLTPGDTVQVGAFDIVCGSDGPLTPKAKRPSTDHWDLANINVRLSGEDQNERERSAATRAFFVLDNAPGAPRIVQRDVYQIGQDAACDLRLEGVSAPRKLAIVVRGHGGWKLVNVAPSGERVEHNGQPVPDQVWLADGDRLALDTLELVFHEGVPTDDLGTMALQRPPWVKGSS
jgi:pSer/pThr/pTyr-binding forkhead associated (FHA) protein